MLKFGLVSQSSIDEFAVDEPSDLWTLEEDADVVVWEVRSLGSPETFEPSSSLAPVDRETPRVGGVCLLASPETFASSSFLYSWGDRAASSFGRSCCLLCSLALLPASVAFPEGLSAGWRFSSVVWRDSSRR